MSLQDNRSAFEHAHFATQLAKAPLGVFDAQSQKYRLIPAATKPLILRPSQWQALIADTRYLLSGLQKLLSWLRRPEQAQRAQQLFSELSGLELEAALGPLRRSQNKGYGQDDAGLAALRLDLFFTETDELKVIEINATIPAMQAYSDIIAQAYLNAQLKQSHSPATIAELANRQSNSLALLRSLLRHYERAEGTKPNPRLAIVARPGDSQRAELAWHQARWQEAGYECLLLTPDQLTLKGKNLCFEGGEIDAVYRHIFAYRLPAGSPFAQALAEAQTFKVFNPIAAHYELKGLLAELSRVAATESTAETVGLNSDENQAIQRRVPWTRLLLLSDANAEASKGLDDTTPLLDWVKAEQASLVVKNNSGYGGHRVFIGASFGPEESRQAAALLGVKEALDWGRFVELCAAGKGGLWVVQERIAGKVLEQEILRAGQFKREKTYIDCSLFADSGIEPQQFGGASRFAASTVVNIGTGGGLIPFFPLGLP